MKLFIAEVHDELAGFVSGMKKRKSLRNFEFKGEERFP
jgi:hypothetical protein